MSQRVPSYLHSVESAFEQLQVLLDLLNQQLKRPGFKVTVTRHSGGMNQPMYATFYLNFWPEINHRCWVRSESIEEKDLFDTDKVVADVTALFNERFNALRKQPPGPIRY